MRLDYPLRLAWVALCGALWMPHAASQRTADLGGAATTPPEAPAETSAPAIILRPTIPAYYPGCGHEAEGTDAKATCSAQRLMGFIAQELRYPEEARAQGIEGVVVLSFVVSDAGGIEQVRVLRDIGGGCGAEARRVIAGMPAWQPAIYKGGPVYTQFTLPITFGLKAHQFDYTLHTGELVDGEATFAEVVDLATGAPYRATNPRGEELLVTEVVYTFERGGERRQLVTRGAELPERRAFERFVGRKPGRLTVEVNVADGMDIRTLVRQYVVVR